MTHLYHFNRSIKKTGGGDDDAPPMSGAEAKIAEFFEDSHSFNGIPNAVDSGDKVYYKYRYLIIMFR